MDFYIPFWWWNWILRQKEEEANPDAPSPLPPVPAPAPRPRGIFRWLHTERDINLISAGALDTAKRGTWSTLDRKRVFVNFARLPCCRFGWLLFRPIPLHWDSSDRICTAMRIEMRRDPPLRGRSCCYRRGIYSRPRTSFQKIRNRREESLKRVSYLS